MTFLIWLPSPSYDQLWQIIFHQPMWLLADLFCSQCIRGDCCYICHGAAQLMAYTTTYLSGHYFSLWMPIQIFVMILRCLWAFNSITSNAKVAVLPLTLAKQTANISQVTASSCYQGSAFGGCCAAAMLVLWNDYKYGKKIYTILPNMVKIDIRNMEIQGAKMYP